jgi:N-acetylglucosaminyldiphosphoundecaprenol N-acetyl-beta-D-mannosaminyltransferase
MSSTRSISHDAPQGDIHEEIHEEDIVHMEHSDGKVSVLGVLVDPIRSDELVGRVIDSARQGKRMLVSYVNAHNLIVANRDEQYRSLLNGYDIVYPDGFGTVLAARILGHKFPPRSTSADFFEDMLGAFAEQGLSSYLLGAEPGVMEEAVANVRRKYPDVNIAGLRDGYFSAEEEKGIIEEINNLRPDILFVSTGVPHQEKWIERNLPDIHAPIIWASGGVFDFLSGRTSRAPSFMRDNGLEWLHRLIAEPRRLWRRYILGNPVFFFLIAKYMFKREK